MILYHLTAEDDFVVSDTEYLHLFEQAHGIKPLNAQVTGPAGPNRSSDGNQ